MLPDDDTQERTLVQVTPPRFTSDGMLLSASSPLGSIGRYVLEAEIGRGGMGVVYRATDESIGRDVAIKVLHERSANDPDAVRRFLVEARITGQLAHPGIPAVHEIGHLPDRRPFMVMKLIRGRTLDGILKEQGATPCGSLLPVFEQICQAVGYAHSQGIIHRDLKPQNVMVGAFGEVQVMDWGLAKEVRGAEHVVGNAVHIPAAEQSETIAGSVMGTPAFMPPEQAGGATDTIDERADVFGLGAILCVILTGKPPFIGADTESARLLAAAAKLDDAYYRLETSGAEPELVQLAKRCLAADRTARFPHAGEVAIAVAQLRVDADSRAREAELERARTETKAVGERNRRRAQFLLLATLLVLVGLTTIGALWAKQQRAEREQLAETQLLKDAAADRERDIRRKGLHFGITAELDQLNGFFARGMWKEAEENIRQCEEFLEADDDPFLQAQLDRAKRDEIYLKRFDAIRLNKAAIFDGKLAAGKASHEYADAFREYGLDPDAPAAFVEMLKTANVRTALLSAIDDWALTTPDANLQLRLMALTADATGEQWRRDLSRNWTDAKDLLALYDTVPIPQRSAEFVIAVGMQLHRLGGNGTRTLELGLRQFPADFWLHLSLGVIYRSQQRHEAAIGAYRAALAIRPAGVVWSNLGNALRAIGDLPGSVAAHEEATRRNPSDGNAFNGLGNALGAMRNWDAAIAAYAEAARLMPNDAMPRGNLGRALASRGQFVEAAKQFQAAREMEPANPRRQRDVESAERDMARDAKLKTVSAGTAKPTDARDAFGLAQLAAETSHKQYALATRLFLEYFATAPEAEWQRYRSTAARAAILYATGADAPGIDEWYYLQKKAHDWLSADLATVEKAMASNDANARSRAVGALRDWLDDPDFATVRDPASRKNMPIEERTMWERFWAKVQSAAPMK